MPTSAQTMDELEVHYRAYRQIFQAVLKKKTTDPARIESSLNDLDAYARANIQNPDAFIDHIPEFAKRLGIDAAGLGAFIGANFLRAMQIARQAAETPKANAGSTRTGKPASQPSAPAAAPTPTKDKGLMKEILEQFGPLVQPPDRFVSMDWGLVKFVSARGETIPVSLGLFENVTVSAPVPAAAAPTAPAASTAPVAAAPKTAPAVPKAAEQPIIKEILEKFGSVLDIHEKLVPRSYEEFGEGEDEEEEVVEAAPEEIKTAATPQAAKQAAPVSREGSIIKEILNKFGSVLDVTQKLNPKQGPEDGNEVDSDDDEPELAQESSVGETERLPIQFTQYLDTVKALQEYQKTGDQNGYRTWLAGLELGPKTAVGLRNLEAKARRGADVYWPDEYQNLSQHLSVGPDTIQVVHDDLRRFEQLQRLLNKFTDAVRAGDPDMVAAARVVWPQVRMLFNESGDEAALLSRTKIIMLQVPDPARKQKLMAILEPILREAARYLQ